MLNNNLYSKIITKNDKKYIFDILRKKYILYTNEEKVRQHTIKYLMCKLKIPKSHISTEKGFKLENGLKKRFDIIAFNKIGKAAILVECKASRIKISKKVIEQILIYNKKIKSKYLLVTNGIISIAFEVINNEVKQINNIPSYSSL